jgi:4-hydroxybenzoate polyprenyltransferase
MQAEFLLRLLYFTIPANLLIYGINDIADYDTDKKNPKKQAYESLLTPDKQKSMRSLIVVTNIPFLIRAIVQ